MKTENSIREELPFFIIVLAVMAFLYGLTLYTNPAMRGMPEILLFTLLMAAHSLLHWFIPRFLKSLLSTLLYLIIQLIIASLIIFLARDLTLIFGLYMALLGEAVGVFRGVKQKVISISAILLLTVLVALFLLEDADMSLGLIVGIGPGALFVVIYVNLYNRQVEAREKAQALLEELEDANTRLADYAAKVEQLTITAERTRLARELHDTLAQGLSGLILQLEAAAAHLQDGNNRRTEQIIQDAMEKARGTLAEARKAIDDLRNDGVPAASLEESILREAARFTEATGIECTCNLDLAEPPSVSVSDHIRKIITEGLTNIAKHSGAKTCRLSIVEKEGSIELNIEDAGSGFDPATVPEGHWGLLGIRERSRLVEGEAVIESSRGKGTMITVTIPRGIGG